MFGSDRKQIGMKLIQHQVENHLMILYMQKLNTLLKDSMILKFHINLIKILVTLNLILNSMQGKTLPCFSKH